ncbi:pyridoxamine 5'-phosphate oxidase family protein [Streptomyces sp. NRRL B-24484]|uniref:pyridoxamine 5'-phosphate oxidase family protein n=1 Tax=Streptomyces sp. NRRL B-24484 TaxID=1463833 RepID=UPI0004BFFE69|nr:pyridoxamine 5'-phosphate oxidase family protein [Streptomyces sp. NRRL B-24484]
MDKNAAGPADPEVLHRIEVRRKQLGIAEEELARRVRMSPAYFHDLFEAPADFDPGGLLRIATELGMSYGELVEGRSDAPPGQHGPAQNPVLMRLASGECWGQLGTHGIGRVAICGHQGPAVLPVNYLVDGTTIVYRTDPARAAAVGPGDELSFQVDHFDEYQRGGWSVLITGTAEHVDDPDVVQHLAAQPGGESWAGGDRRLWIRIIPSEISGRRVHGL